MIALGFTVASTLAEISRRRLHIGPSGRGAGEGGGLDKGREDGDVREEARRKDGYKNLHGADLNENDNFKKAKLIMHVCKIFHRDDINKMAIFINGIYSCMLTIF